MTSEQERRTVGDYVTLQRGTTYKGSLVGEPGPALFGLGSIEPGGGFRYGHYKTYGGDCPTKLMLFPGDLYVALKGATKDGDMIGSVARVPSAVSSGRLTQDTVKLVILGANTDDSTYLYWILRTPQYRSYCAGHATGSAVVALSRRDFLAFPVPRPTRQRRQIAALLDAIEKKIESNRRTVSAISDLISVSFISLTESCREHEKILDLATLQKGVSYRSADLSPSTTAMVTLKSFDRNGGYKPSGLKPFVGKYKLEQEIHPGELVVAQTDLTQAADVVGRVVRVPKHNDVQTLVASLDLIIVRPKPGIPNEFLYGVLLDEEFRQHCRSRASGTTVLHLASDAFPTYRAPKVSIQKQQQYADQVQPLLQRRDQLGAERERLVTFRDALLPELLSGDLRIPGGHEAVGATV